MSAQLLFTLFMLKSPKNHNDYHKVSRHQTYTWTYRFLGLSTLLAVLTIGLDRTYAQDRDKDPASGNKISSAGAFSAGQNQLSLGGGSSTLANSNYLILQGRFGHFIVDGIILESGLQAWIPLEDGPSVYVLSPGLTGYLYQLGSLVPYGGVFYQYTMTELDLQSHSSIGGRAGILLRQANSHLGLGARVSQGTNCGASCRLITPEISLFLSF